MRSDILPTAKRLISIESTSGQPKKLHAALELVADYVAERSEHVTIERFEQNGKPSFLAYAGKQRPKTFDVLLNGHVDVVPAKPALFEPKIRHGKLFGRGALDMKTAALVLADVFCEIAKNADYALGLQIVTDEEVGGHNGTAYQLEQGVRANFVVCGEFTPESAICNESKGICQVRLHFSGKMAHSAYLWDGDNALLAAYQATTKLLEVYPIPKAKTWATTINVSTVATTNATINQVPDDATVDLDIRYVPDDPNFADSKAVEAFFETVTPSAKAEVLMYEPAHYADTSHPLSQKLAAALAKTTGRETKFIQKPGAADVRFYSSRNIPAVVIGLQGGGLHGDDEYLLLSSVEQYHAVLRSFLLDV